MIFVCRNIIWRSRGSEIRGVRQGLGSLGVKWLVFSSSFYFVSSFQFVVWICRYSIRFIRVGLGRYVVGVRQRVLERCCSGRFVFGGCSFRVGLVWFLIIFFFSDVLLWFLEGFVMVDLFSKYRLNLICVRWGLGFGIQ